MVRLIIVFCVLTITNSIFGQSADNAFYPSGKPILQVFGTAFYEIENIQHTFNYRETIPLAFLSGSLTYWSIGTVEWQLLDISSFAGVAGATIGTTNMQKRLNPKMI